MFLTEFERKVLLACVNVELDKYREIYKGDTFTADDFDILMALWSVHYKLLELDGCKR